MLKNYFSSFLRKIRLLYFADFFSFLLNKRKNKSRNLKFKKDNPNVPLPPDYLIYESFQIDYNKYYTDSIETAKWLSKHFNNYIDLQQGGFKILDWGCGPGRIIRHLPNIIGLQNEYLGTDYNEKTIEWCKSNLANITFNLNTLEAKLPYEGESIDVIYGISIFTHLSEELQFQWIKELTRILKPNGVLFLTTQGDAFKVKLTDKELKIYNTGKVVIRGNVKEGHRTYSAFHPKPFVKKLFKHLKILEHIENQNIKNQNPQQDIWILSK